jgi:hypothetical protein
MEMIVVDSKFQFKRVNENMIVLATVLANFSIGSRYVTSGIRRIYYLGRKMIEIKFEGYP